MSRTRDLSDERRASASTRIPRSVERRAPRRAPREARVTARLNRDAANIYVVANERASARKRAKEQTMCIKKEREREREHWLVVEQLLVVDLEH